MDQPALRRIIVKYSKRMGEAGWGANHLGNLTARLDRNRVLLTPTAYCKQDITEEDLVVVDMSTGKQVSGRNRPFSELALHLEYYKVRDDVQAVIHAHPPATCAFATAGIEIEPRLSAEALITLGDRIPLAPAALPGRLESQQQVRTLARLFDVILLGNHGVIACGEDLEQAYLRIELTEHLATVQHQAMLLGSVRTIPDAWVADLLKKRKAAGLGPEARGDKAPPPKHISELPVEEIIKGMVEQIKD